MLAFEVLYQFLFQALNSMMFQRQMVYLWCVICHLIYCHAILTFLRYSIVLNLWKYESICWENRLYLNIYSNTFLYINRALHPAGQCFRGIYVFCLYVFHLFMYPPPPVYWRVFWPIYHLCVILVWNDLCWRSEEHWMCWCHSGYYTRWPPRSCHASLPCYLWLQSTGRQQFMLQHTTNIQVSKPLDRTDEFSTERLNHCVLIKIECFS